MTSRLVLADEATARDALTFAGRAARAGDGGIRLQASDGVLVMSTAVLAPAGLLDRTPTIVAMRVLDVDPELRCDVTVTELSPSDAPTELLLPDTAIAPAWAGISPPRGEWVRTGAELDAAVVANRAQWGVSAITHALPTSPGEEIVRTVRSEIWGEPDDDLAGLPRGVAFAASSLGFIAGEERAPVFTTGRWMRLSFVRGHVLARARN